MLGARWMSLTVAECSVHSGCQDMPVHACQNLVPEEDTVQKLGGSTASCSSGSLAPAQEESALAAEALP